MRGDVAMHDAPCPDLHQEEHIERWEPGSHHDQEIAGDETSAQNPVRVCYSLQTKGALI